ncbi:MAG: polysaccharide pyruvyl transferase family protein [Oscillospiraceae bacterium]|nr:polysaccharide pyruvyl transferase family protein [Oscillospiraceae bacterium]
MRIGTITVHNGYNYGASLQAHALVHFLRSRGFDAYLLDYRAEKIERQQAKSEESSPVVKFINRLLFNSAGYALRRERFDSFNCDIMNAKADTYYTLQELKKANELFDCFICGSDQIWNPAITDGDEAFFLGFAERNKKCIAYAPSLGTETIADEAFFKHHLQRFCALSVREAHNAADIERLSGKSCTTVVDPVLLLSREHWIDTAGKAAPVKPKKPYVFYYTLHPDEELFSYAKAEAKRRKAVLLRVDILPAKAILKGCRSISNKGVGPAEFVQLIMGAEYIITNSFHGTAFSVLLEKDFCVKLLSGKLAGKNLRITQLLSQVGLADRILREQEKKDSITEWSSVRAEIEAQRNYAASYLCNAINQE